MQRTIEGMFLEQEIVKRGFAEINHGIPSDWIDDLVEKYASFTLNYPDPDPSTMNAMLPDGDTAEALQHRLDDLDYSKDTQTDWHKYRTSVVGVGKPDGYTNRSFQVSALRRARGILLPHEDPKEFYHHTPRHRAKMGRQHEALGWGLIPSEVDKLDTSFSRIHHKIGELIMIVSRQIEETHPGLDRIITPESLLGSPLRLLFYHPSAHTQLAAGHFDKSVITLQIAESHRGLRVATHSDQPLMPVSRDDTKGVLFASNTLSAKPKQDGTGGGHFPDSLLRPAWHDVIADDQANEGRNVPLRAQDVCARWSLIFFVNEYNYVDPGKVAMHQRR